MPCLIYCDEKAYMGGGGERITGTPGHPPHTATPLLYHDWVENTPAFPSGQS